MSPAQLSLLDVAIPLVDRTGVPGVLCCVAAMEDPEGAMHRAFPEACRNGEVTASACRALELLLREGLELQWGHRWGLMIERATRFGSRLVNNEHLRLSPPKHRSSDLNGLEIL